MSGSPRPTSCPSAQPGMPGARVIGVVRHDHETPDVEYLPESLPITTELLELASPLLPTEIFRFAASCQQSACAHWEQSQCSLVERMVGLIPTNALTLPRCAARATCQWYAQRRASACRVCPLVVTQNEAPSSEMRAAAMPPDNRKNNSVRRPGHNPRARRQ